MTQSGDFSKPNLQPTASGNVALHRKTPSLSTYQTTPITKHYALNNQILSAFDSFYEQKHYQIAYAVGLQFVETALLEIPKHGYFYSRRHEQERMHCAVEAARVTFMLQQLQELHEEELGPRAGEMDQKRVQRLAQLAREQVEKASMDQDQYERGRRAAEEEKLLQLQDEASASWVVCEPLLAASDSLSSIICPPRLNESPPMESFSASPVPPPPELKSSAHVESAPRSKRATADTAPEPLSLMESRPSPGAKSLSSASLPLLKSHTAPAWVPDRWSKTKSSSLRSVETILTNASEPRKSDPYAVAVHVPAPPSALRQRETGAITTVEASATDPSWLLVGRTPQYSNTATASEDILLEKALFLSGLEVQTVPSDSVLVLDDNGDVVEESGRRDLPIDEFSDKLAPPSLTASSSFDLQQQQQLLQQQQQRRKSAKLEISTLSNLYHEDFDSLIQSRRVAVSFTNTYQGRIQSSTNGCTVIAPLLCIHHLLESNVPDHGLPDETIEYVIDEETPAILQQVRQQLGLAPTAFLIPSDVHDYLIEHGQLNQRQFVTVVGGNILDDRHLQTLVHELEDQARRQDSRKGHKVAATLFFHEHVVAILQLRRDYGDTVWYDIIDSLPLKDTVARMGETPEECTQRLGLIDEADAASAVSSEPDSVDYSFLSEVWLPKTARIRCSDAESLKAVLRWYACSKFTEENMIYIDQYVWDDSSCDFDPRVFQAFVWSTMPAI